MLKVGRNEPCPCGSGKKYKKCCEKNAVISMHQVVHNELIELQKDIIDFSISYYQDELSMLVAEQLEDLFMPDDLEEIYWFMGINNALFSCPVVDGKTCIEFYIDKHLRSIKRPKIAEILKSWVKGKPFVLQVVSIHENELVVQDVLTKDQSTVILLEERNDISEGIVITGIFVPMGDTLTPFTTFMDFSKEEATAIQNTIFKLYENSDMFSPNEWLQRDFLKVLDACYFSSFQSEIVENMPWESPVHKEVVEQFQTEMKNEENADVLVGLGVTLWFKYCERESPIIKNKGIYAAAIHYLVDNLVYRFDTVTFKELASRYGASASSISKRVRMMEEVLADEIDSIVQGIQEHDSDDFLEESPFTTNRFMMERSLLESERKLEGVDFENMDDLNTFLNDESVPSRPLTKEEQAQELAFDAYEASGRKREELIKKVLNLDPNNADAYNILAEEANTFEEALNCYREGMIRGEKSLGKAFFEENKGHFWGVVKTRPFMRAKYNYAYMLYGDDQLDEAILHFEELLELNPNDNQGVRFILFNAFVETNQLNKAKQLLNNYPNDGSVHFVYNKLLIELLENGSTNRAKQLRNDAIKRNPFVLEYLLEDIEVDSIPSYFKPGDENEAIIYVEESGHLWLDNKGDIIESLVEILE
ncbi:tetratricopeptide repeat protein [Bacillus sp. FJAT-47783]|uniref:tetratricopeptide repeat protein n=1 Tax=Bacillus sp. FJAT-47783 TaxID=2922712 RepID=UPI001FAC6265|nr:tetratricopeptide repeat protein [Bacillus sp. FJAT-47783]